MTFTRRSIADTDMPNWSTSQMSFENTLLHVSDDGTIEDEGKGLLQVDFANKYLGGGVLNYGCVQEEIRFVICPELLISRLFTEALTSNECMIIMGCERYNAYEGYASSFEFTGTISDDTPRDCSRRRKCTIVAIDAIPFSNRRQQYQEKMLKRELNKVRCAVFPPIVCNTLELSSFYLSFEFLKAFVGFKHDLPTPAPAVATGNWGCGAFGGDKLLKSLLQLMACCVTQRPLVYYTFGDRDLRQDLLDMHRYLRDSKVTVGRQLFSLNVIEAVRIWLNALKFYERKFEIFYILGELWSCLKKNSTDNSGVHLYEFIMKYHKYLR